MISLKPLSEISILLVALENSKAGLQSGAYQTLLDVLFSIQPLEVHESISPEQVKQFLPLLLFVEEEIEVPLTDAEVWRVHGIFEDFLIHRTETDPEFVSICSELMDKLMRAVAETEMPPA